MMKTQRQRSTLRFTGNSAKNNTYYKSKRVCDVPHTGPGPEQTGSAPDPSDRNVPEPHAQAVCRHVTSAELDILSVTS